LNCRSAVHRGSGHGHVDGGGGVEGGSVDARAVGTQGRPLRPRVYHRQAREVGRRRRGGGVHGGRRRDARRAGEIGGDDGGGGGAERGASSVESGEGVAAAAVGR